jgi:hypothetical protein
VADTDDTDFPRCSIADCDRRGVHYFGEMKVPIEGTGEHVDAGTTDFDFINEGEQFDVVEWTGEYQTVQYYECNEHYYERDDDDDADDADRLEDDTCYIY